MKGLRENIFAAVFDGLILILFFAAQLSIWCRYNCRLIFIVFMLGPDEYIAVSSANWAVFYIITFW